jgi:broad specificity phosphatase PhoE
VLLVVRHGETVANRAGQYLGRTDLELTDVGQRQARALARSLPRPDLVISSPLRRAMQTAAAFGTPVEVDDRWIELDYGPLELTPVGALPTDELARWDADPSEAPPGVETLATLAARVRPACDDLVRGVADADVVVIVTHVSPMKAALAWALDVDVRISARLFVEDAGVARIDVVDGVPLVRWFNRMGVEPGGALGRSPRAQRGESE